MTSPQALSEADRRLVALWAADCAERVLPLFEAEAPDDDRARNGIDRARAFGRGELDTAEQIRRRFVAGRAAQSTKNPAAVAAARAAGQASGVAHMGARALGAAAYAAKAAALAAADHDATGQDAARRHEARWQLDHLTTGVRIALSRLPLLGEDSSGPLGAGLLASGVLATTIREIQAELSLEADGVGGREAADEWERERGDADDENGTDDENSDDDKDGDESGTPQRSRPQMRAVRDFVT